MNPEHKNNRRGVLVTGGILIVAILVIWMSYKVMSSGKSPQSMYQNTSTSTGTNTVSTEGWQTFTNASSTLTFKYPADFGTKYVHTVDWPPQFMVMNAPYSCENAGKPQEQGGITKEILVDGRKYCMTVEDQGAAGTIYSQYAFSFTKNGKLIIMTFTLRRPQCGNYPEPQMTECTQEERSFDITKIVDQIAATVTFT